MLPSTEHERIADAVSAAARRPGLPQFERERKLEQANRFRSLARRARDLEKANSNSPVSSQSTTAS